MNIINKQYGNIHKKVNNNFDNREKIKTFLDVIVIFTIVTFTIIFFLSLNVSADKEYNNDFHNSYNKLYGPFQTNDLNITFRGPLFVGKGQLNTLTLDDIDKDGDFDILVTLEDGDYYLLYYENSGNMENPIWEENTSMIEGVIAGPSTFVNLDNDENLDLVIGKIDDRYIYYNNIGTAIEPEWVEKPEIFLGVEDDGVPTFADLDNDKDFDLIVGLNYYENIGTVDEPEWKKDNSMLTGIDSSGDIRLAFTDIDDDRDLDLVIANRTDKIYYYENIGNPESPIWEENSSMFSGIEQILCRAVEFADLDDDGDLDLSIGGLIGNLNLYENTGTMKKPIWSEDISMFTGTILGGYAKPTFADLDNDGDLDLIVGESNGELSYYENIGNSKVAKWTEDTSMLSGISPRPNPKPAFADLDDDGDFDLTIGGEDGTLFYYNNTGTPKKPVWTEENSKFAEINVGGKSSPIFADLDNDGDFDLTIGEHENNLNFYENTGTEKNSQWTESTMMGGLDVGFQNVPSFVDLDDDDDFDLTVGNEQGSLKYFENIGTKNEAEWSENNEMFSGIETSELIIPVFADLDNDGDFDLIIPKSDLEHSTLILFESLVIQYPRAFIDEISPNPVNEKESIFFKGHGIATDSEITRYVWRSSIDDEFYDGTNADFYYDKLSNGTHSIYFKIQDKFAWWSDETSGTLHINGIPIAKIDELKPNSAKENEIIWFYGNGSDDGEISEYYWSSNINGFLNNERSFSTSILSIGIHEISFKVKDNFGIWSDIVTDTLLINQNQKPSAIIDSISPNPAKNGKSVIFKEKSFDVDGTIVKFEWDFDGDGTWDWDSIETGNTTYIYNNLGIFYAKLRVTDNDGSVDIDTLIIYVNNSLPIVDKVIISPSNPKTLDDLIINYEYFDDDGDKEIGTMYRWYKNEGDGFIITDFITKTIEYEHTKKGEFWKCEVIPNDGTSLGESVISEEIEIINSNPIVKNIKINPDNPKTSDELTVSYEYDDMDGDLESSTIFKWFKDTGNGFENKGITTHSIAPTKTAKHEFWKCLVTPNDGEDFGEGVWSDIIEIVNSKPKAIISSPLNNEIFEENEQVSFNGQDSFDDDYDKLAFEWVINDKKISVDPNFKYTLPFGKNKITIIVDDTNGGTDSISINLTVIEIPSPLKPNYEFNENDIYIDGIPKVGDTIKIFAKVSNIGNIDGVVTVKFYEDRMDSNHYIGEGKTLSVKVSTTYNVSVEWIPLTKGDHTIIVVIENIEPINLDLNNIVVKKVVNVLEKEKKDSGLLRSFENPLVIISLGICALFTASITGTEVGKYKFLLLFFLPLYTRIKRNKLLDNESRGMIRGYIIANPGDHYSSIKRVLRFKNGKLMYHLEILERNGLIRSEALGTTRRFYPVGFRSPNAEHVLEVIKDAPGLSQKEIIVKTKIKQQTVSRILMQMIENGNVRADKMGRKKHYYFIETKIQTKPFKNCPFCGEYFKLRKIPKLCPYCKEPLT